MLDAALPWLAGLSALRAAAFFVAMYAVAFALAAAVGDVVVRLRLGVRITAPPPPVRGSEWLLALACVVVNAAVTLGALEIYKAGYIVFRAPSVAGAIASAVAMTLVMDAAMYATHRIAHVPLLYRHVHRIHHEHTCPRPMTLFVLHPLEVLGFSALWVLVAALLPMTFDGLVLYFGINLAAGLLGHLGIEPIPAKLRGWGLLRYFGTSTFHADHHQNPDGNYGFYTVALDRVFRSHHARRAPTSDA